MRNVWFPAAMSIQFHASVSLSLFSSKQCMIKQLSDSVFVISGKLKSQQVLSASDSTLIIPDITKTSSNNCLLIVLFQFNNKQENLLCKRLQVYNVPLMFIRLRGIIYTRKILKSPFGVLHRRTNLQTLFYNFRPELITVMEFTCQNMFKLFY